ncbi:MAG: hypothetical protein Q9195_009111 [Heterodermia aff. obscurata]
MSSTGLDGPVALPPDTSQSASSLHNNIHSAHLPPNNFPSHPPQDDASSESPAESPKVGMAYESMAAAKKHITEWCARERIPYSVWKADRRCWVLTCKDKNNCLFRLRVKNVDRPIISILEAHTCSSLSFRRTAQTGGPIKATPYNWPHDASLAPNTTALVLVDMQQDFCRPGGFLEHQGEDISPFGKIIPSLVRLLQAFRGAGFPVYHTREGHREDLTTLSSREAFRSQNNTSGLGIGYPGPLGRFMVRGEEGHDIIPELYPVPGEPIIDKPGRGAFSYTDFELLLRNKGVQNLVIAGIATDVSISSTIREATDRGFDCLLVEDGCAAKDAKLHKAACEVIALGGGAFGATAKLNHVAGQLEYVAHERRNGLEHSMMPRAPM